MICRRIRLKSMVWNLVHKSRTSEVHTSTGCSGTFWPAQSISKNISVKSALDMAVPICLEFSSLPASISCIKIAILLDYTWEEKQALSDAMWPEFCHAWIIDPVLTLKLFWSERESVFFVNVCIVMAIWLANFV